VIKYLYYWEKAVNIGEYWPDGLHNIRTDHVIECYFACPKCGEILFFDDVEAADKLLRGPAHRGRDMGLLA
jgi:hypothetical protein